MKVKFAGGKQKIVKVVDGKRMVEEVEVKSLMQEFEGREYFWPKVGAVMSLPDSVAAWMAWKHPGILVLGKPDADSKPGRIEAVVPVEEPAKPPPAAPTK